jgi:hypothetical protein
MDTISGSREYALERAEILKMNVTNDGSRLQHGACSRYGHSLSPTQTGLHHD